MKSLKYDMFIELVRVKIIWLSTDFVGGSGPGASFNDIDVPPGRCNVLILGMQMGAFSNCVRRKLAVHSVEAAIRSLLRNIRLTNTHAAIITKVDGYMYYKFAKTLSLTHLNLTPCYEPGVEDFSFCI